MKVYEFCDWSLTDDEDYDIVGAAYEHLIKRCCDICDVVSFIIERPEICSEKIQENLSEFSIPHPENISYRFRHYGERSNNDQELGVHYYRSCPELCQLLQISALSIFDWIGHTYPEDITFYRSDGSIFFTSITHEGLLFLVPRENEDVSDILAMGNWVETKNHWLSQVLSSLNVIKGV